MFRIEKCYKKTESIKNSEKLKNKLKFIGQFEKITSKDQFVYIPYLIEDLISGMSKTRIFEKYHLTSWQHIDRLTRILEFRQNRHLAANYENAKIMNLKIPGWNEQYQDLKKNCKYFQDELNEFYFEKILRAYIFIIMFDYQENGIDISNLINHCRNESKDYFDEHDNKKKLFRFVDEKLLESFQEYLNDNLQLKIQETLDDFINLNIVKRKKTNPKFFVNPVTIDKLKEMLIIVLGVYSTGLRRYAIQQHLSSYEPGLKEIPGIDIMSPILSELDDQIIIKKGYWLRQNDFVILRENDEEIKEKIRLLEEKVKKIHGRKISPDDFINELNELEKGNFEDEDDQVTRLAGLALASSVKLLSPQESIPEFDFSMNLKDCDSQLEEIGNIKLSNYILKSKIIHCKVMIHEKITLQKLNKLQQNMPDGEQGLIFSFEPITKRVVDKIIRERKIQIINQKDLKQWVSMTKIIPARVNSISKIYFDPLTNLENKLVLVNSVNYESGFASVSILPEMEEQNVLIKALEEIPINIPNVNDFPKYSKNYLEFLQLIMKLSTYNNFIDGLFRTKLENAEHRHPAKIRRHFVFEHHHVAFDGREERHEADIMSNAYDNPYRCSCLGWADNNHQFCPHLIYSLDHTARNSQFLATWNEEHNSMQNALEKFICEYVAILLDELLYDLNSEQKNLIYKMIPLVEKI